MPVDPQVQALLTQMKTLNRPHTYEVSVAEARANIRMLRLLTGGEAERVYRVEERSIPGPEQQIPIRIYRPQEGASLPALVYFHGGGWVIGDLETHDDVCRHLANKVGCVVISVDYRLAPEHRYPAAPEDCYAATHWVYHHASELKINPGKIAVGGDSAGGNLATVVSLMAREQGGPPLVFQLLIYPVTDHYTIEKPSYKENGEGYFLEYQDMVWFTHHYLPQPDTRYIHDPLVCPLYAPNLKNLPPALVLTAEYDPLRNEGELYAQKLQQAGVPTGLIRYDGLIHGFINLFGLIDKSAQSFDDIAQVLQEAFD